MPRWGRALRLLPPPPAEVLDCGCAFGFLTCRLVRRYGAASVRGIDLDASYVARARRACPGADIRQGSAAALPWDDACADAAVCLDVLEHVDDPRAVVAELARVLRPGATLVVSVPHQGPLAWADALNLYSRLLPHRTPPTDDPSWALVRRHRHFGVGELTALLAPEFSVARVIRTGTGIAEALQLALLLGTRALSPRLRRFHSVLEYAYFGLYALDDMLPTGRAGYSVTVAARRRAARLSASAG